MVHGGGDEISQLQLQLGRQPSFVNGRRITTADDMELVRMVLSGAVNKRLVATLVSEGIPAVGVSGEDAATITATAIDAEKFGRAGKVTSVRVQLIDTLLSAHFMPVISPVARDADGPDGMAMNVNGDDAAAAVARALNADLIMVADVEGVMDANGNVVASLDTEMMLQMIETGEISGGMRAKLEAGFVACSGGVNSVRIGSFAAIADKTKGTLLTPDSSSVP